MCRVRYVTNRFLRRASLSCACFDTSAWDGDPPTERPLAGALVGAFYAWRQGVLAYEEAYLDLLSGRHVPVQRKLQVRRRGAPSLIV